MFVVLAPVCGICCGGNSSQDQEEAQSLGYGISGNAAAMLPPGGRSPDSLLCDSRQVHSSPNGL